MINSNMRVRKVVISSLLAAMICVATTFFHVPLGGNGGYVHIGDAFIYLSASILPLPYAMISAAVGASLADLFSGATVWVIPTMIIKPILVLFFTSRNIKILCFRNTLATIFAGVAGVLLYCLADYLLFGNFAAAFYMSFVSLLQPVGSAVVFLLLAGALDRIKFKSKVSFNKI